MVKKIDKQEVIIMQQESIIKLLKEKYKLQIRDAFKDPIVDNGDIIISILGVIFAAFNLPLVIVLLTFLAALGLFFLKNIVNKKIRRIHRKIFKDIDEI